MAGSRSHQIERIDKAMMLAPPSPRLWPVEHPNDLRFGWDKHYRDAYGQKFSPWYFAKNCAAVLGHVRVHGRTGLMNEMALHLFNEMSNHVTREEGATYIANDFAFDYLWQTFQPPFFGAFMNNVTAFGLLQLYEATNSERYLLLAYNLLLTAVDQRGNIPLSSWSNDGLWLHEYVFRSEPGKSPVGPVDFPSRNGWRYSKIFNGHIHALLAYFRFRQMTESNEFDRAIDGAVEAMKRDLPRQIFEGRYFSYCMEVPAMPDYGQERAYLLAHGLGQVTGDGDISALADRMRNIYQEDIAGREQEIIHAARDATKASLKNGAMVL